MKRIALGKYIQVSDKATSIHKGQKGIVVADYGSHYMIQADDQKHQYAHKNTEWDLKVFQADERHLKEIKNDKTE